MLAGLNSTMKQYEREALYTKAVNSTSLERQVIHLVEEESELNIEISHLLRGRKTDKVEFVKELADVAIMLDEMRVLFGVSVEAVRAAVDEKLAKFAAQMADKP